MFDARAAKSLSDGDHLTFPECPGLRLVAHGDQRTFTYRYRSPVDGALRQVKLGRWPAMGFPAAVAAWQRKKMERDAGADPAAAKRLEREARARTDTNYTVRRACDDFLAAYQGSVAPKTYAEAARLLEIELGDVAEMQAADVTRSVAYGLISAKRDKPVAAASLRRLLGAVWDDALDAGRLADDVPNWWRQILRGKLQSKGKVIGGERQGVVKRSLSEEELRVVLRFMPNFSRDVRDVCELYLWTGCRGAEICAMERSEVGVEDDGLLWWTVPREKLKMRRNPLTCDLRVPLFGRAADIVRRRLDIPKGRWLFSSVGKSGHVEQRAIGVAVWSHMPYAGTRPNWVRPRLTVTHWAPHDLRRTSRTLLSKLGCPSDVGEAILGHLPPGVQGIHNRHQYDEERKLWLKRLAARLDVLSSSQALTRSR